MSLANESKPDRNSHYVDLLRSAKRLLLPHGYCDFVYSSTVSRGSPDKPDGETIFNVLRCALHINSGRIIYNFAFGATAFAERSAAMKAPVGLLSGRAVCVSRWRGFAPTSSAERSKRIFTGGVVTASGICSAAFYESAALREASSPSPSRLTPCHLSQRERPWQKDEVRVDCQGLPLWGSWQIRRI